MMSPFYKGLLRALYLTFCARMSPYYKGLIRALYLTFRAMMSPYIPADLIFDHPARKTLEESRSCVVVRIAAVKQTWKKG